ncbi:hypothetical protein ACYJ1Y_01545 [Natrialbaceae archaeon A-gly3]
MFDVLLHTGTEHPNLLWIVVPSLLSFLAGVGIGSYSGRLKALLSELTTGSTK